MEFVIMFNNLCNIWDIWDNGIMFMGWGHKMWDHGIYNSISPFTFVGCWVIRCETMELFSNISQIHVCGWGHKMWVGL
jgi:hypothetical protein